MQVVDALQLSRRTFSKIRQNLGWAFAYNAIALPLAAGALLPGFGIALTPSVSGAAGCTAVNESLIFCSVALWVAFAICL